MSRYVNNSWLPQASKHVCFWVSAIVCLLDSDPCRGKTRVKHINHVGVLCQLFLFDFQKDQNRIYLISFFNQSSYLLLCYYLPVSFVLLKALLINIFEIKFHLSYQSLHCCWPIVSAPELAASFELYVSSFCHRLTYIVPLLMDFFTPTTTTTTQFQKKPSVCLVFLIWEGLWLGESSRRLTWKDKESERIREMLIKVPNTKLEITFKVWLKLLSYTV